MVNDVRSIVGPQITSFHYNIDKKKLFPAGATFCTESARPPHVCVGFLQMTAVSSHIPKCARLHKSGVSTLPQSE